MACLVPQFKCPSSFYHHHSLQVKPRGPFNFRNQCVSYCMTAVIDLDKAYVPTQEAHTTTSADESCSQEGCRGLVKGAEKFDASKGFKFSTYAHWWIKQAVRRSFSGQSRTIRLPFHMVEASYRVQEAKKQLYSENGRHPDDEEIAEATGLTMKRVTAVMLIPKAPSSLEQKIGIDQTVKLSEVIADPDALSTGEILIKQLMKEDLNKELDSLNPREKQVVRWRFGLEDGRMKALQEIGEMRV